MLEWLRNRLVRSAAERLSIPEETWAGVEATLPFLSPLSPPDRMRLRGLARAFIVEKQWTAAQGLVLDASMQLSIALQACLLVLNLGLDWYRGWVGIIIYPGDFVIPRASMDENGVVHEYEDPILGEAWEGGPLLLSWFPAAEQPRGINVVIHEFAHKLDMLHGGIANGMPPLHPGMSRHDWQSAMSSAYEDFLRDVEHGKEITLDPYGAEHPGEFFAVLSEAFFETPEIIRNRYPEVYEQLQQFYRQDPCAAS